MQISNVFTYAPIHVLHMPTHMSNRTPTHMPADVSTRMSTCICAHVSTHMPTHMPAHAQPYSPVIDYMRETITLCKCARIAKKDEL